MKRLLLLSGSSFRRIMALSLLAAVAPACGKTPHPPVFPNPGTIGFLQAVFTAAENGGTATITVRRSGGTMGAVSVNYATSSGTATSGTDFTAANGTLSWADGDAADKTFTVTITNDGAVEGDETVGLTLSLPTGGAGLGLFAAILNITDDDAPAAGVVQFDSATYSVSEATTTAVITVTRTGGSTGAASVNWSIPAGGTATGGGVDYAATPGTLNWAAGDATPKTFTITIANDGTPEPTETVNLLLSGAAGASLGTTSTAVLSILDNDSAGTLQFSAAAYSVSESGFMATITVTRTGGIGGAVGVTYASSNGTATAGADYTAANGTLSWGDGDGSDKTFAVFITDDTTVEGNETINLTLSAPTGGAALGLAAAVLTILDDDCTIQFTNATYNLTEAGGTQTITVSRVGSTLGTATVDFADAGGGSATGGGTDYTVTAGTLTWAIGDAANKTISIPVVGDSLAEDNEIINLVLTNAAGVGARLGTQATAVATIVDDDVQFVFSSPTYSVGEAGGNVVLTVNRVGASNGAASVVWTVTGGTAANPADFTGPVTGTLNWASGVTTAQTITIPIVSDSLAETNETIIVDLSAPTLAGGNATLGAVSQATVTITDDDTNLAFSQATYTVAENVAGGTLTVTVNRTGITTGASSVTWSVAGGGTATGGGTDFTAPGGTLNFVAGDTSKTFTITIVDDLVVEGTETINLQLTGPTGATLGAQNTATVNITDDDAPGTLAYTAATFTVAESIGNALITVSRTGGVGNAVAVTWNITGGSATSGGVDFSGPLTGTLNWAAGDSANKTITIPIVDDFLVEGTENILLNLTGATGGATIGAQNSTTVNITDNDVPGSIQFTNATYNFTENSGVVNVTVSRTGGVGNAVSVDWIITGGSATGGANDYAATPGTLNWAAGDGANKNIQITLTPDNLVEPTETVLLQIQNATGGATLGGQQTATLNIVDDDTNYAFSAPTYSLAENGGTLTVTVNRTGITTGAGSVNWSITGGTATGGGTDYTVVTGPTINFAAGDTSKTISITIVDDFAIEGDETINLALNTPVGGTLGSQNTAIATILDDDSPGTLQFTAANFNVNEGGTATITVSRTGGVGGTVGLTFATSNGSATSPGDYTPNTNTLSWGPGDSTNKSFTVATLPDAAVEGTETVNLTLSAPSGGAALGLSTAVLNIADSAGSITLSSSTYSVNENGGTAVITLNRVNGNGGPVSVQLSTSNGTATAPADYTAVTNQLVSWTDGDTAAKTVNITIQNDTVGEGDETVFINLSNLTGGASFGANSSATLTIVDDDTSLVFSSSTYTVNENVGGGTVTITVNRVGVLTNAVDVNYVAAPGTATDGLDFNATNGTLSWGAGVGGSKTFTVTIIDDVGIDPNETILLSLNTPTNGATLGTPNTATLTIIDDDVPGTLDLSSANYNVNEGAGTVTITVNRTGGSGGSVSVQCSTSNGTAIAGSDYTATAPTLSWAAGVTGPKTFTIAITDDAIVESNETINLTLSNPTGGATIGAQGTATVTINDNDTALQFSSTTYSIGEGAGVINIAVNRVGATANAVDVSVSTVAGGTATAGTDYVSITNQVISWGAGDGSTKTFAVTINEDATVEPNETVFLSLSNPTNGAVLGSPSAATLTINDNDGPTVTNANPNNASPGVSTGTHLVLDFSMAMDPTTFTSGTTVTLSPDPSGGALTAAQRMQFFWNATFDQVTIVFDTKTPVGIFGDDVLAPGTLYTVTLLSGAGGVKSSTGTGSIPMVSDYITTFTTFTSGTTLTYTVAPDLNTPIPAGTTVFTVTFNQAMQTGNGNVQVKSNYGYKADANVTDTFPHNGIQSMVWSGGNTIMTVTLVTGVPANALYRFQIDSFNSTSNAFLNNNREKVFATPGPTGTAPTVTAQLPANGSVVSRDQEILLGFSAPMRSDDLLDPLKVVVSGTGINQANLDRDILDFSGVFLRYKGGWPASTAITVTVNTTVRNAAGVNIAAPVAWTFTTDAGDATALTVDGPFSTLTNGATSVDINGISGTWVFLRSGGNRAFINDLTLAPRDMSISESAAPFIPVKGYTIQGNNGGLELQSDMNFSSLKYSTGYKITFNTTMLGTQGGIPSTAGSANVINFTTRANAAPARPQMFGGGDSRYTTKPGDIEVEFRRDVYSPTGQVLTVSAQDSVNTAFQPALSNGGGTNSNFQYQSGSNEALLTTSGAREIIYTVTGGPSALTMREKGFIFDTSTYPTLPTPVAGGTVGTFVFNWGALSAGLKAQAPGMALGIIKVGNNDPSYIVLLPNTATGYTLPVDQKLPTGSYQYILHFFHPTDGVFQGASNEGETLVNTTPFVVP